MAKIDRIREQIAYEKQAMFGLMAAEFAILGWLFVNFGTVGIAALCIAASNSH